MTPRELRAAWDAAADTLTPEMTARGFSRRGRGWIKKEKGSNRSVTVFIERTVRRYSVDLNVSGVGEITAPLFGSATSCLIPTRVCDWERNLTSIDEIPALRDQLQSYLLEELVPELTYLLSNTEDSRLREALIEFEEDLTRHFQTDIPALVQSKMQAHTAKDPQDSVGNFRTGFVRDVVLEVLEKAKDSESTAEVKE